MITLKKVNKYFNRYKKNEIHVINDTSLEFGDTGLVALLGPSGCGKTTLLNAIGGLDKINSGKIYINGRKMPKRGSSKKDAMRVLSIGYIFQDYNLLDNMTVYENVALSLKMIGLKNRFEIKKRVEYVLNAVGMYRYRNKPAGMLSGGQRQRVGIARALVKNPEVIIADEPTGNLDSKNTIEVMNIIKTISQNKLVILVTHEKDLAHFYASRIVNLEDGKVIGDADNAHENELDYRIDNKIYLKDFEDCEEASGKNYDINIYRDKKEKLNLDIVIKNGNIYIRSKNSNKIEVVDEQSAVEFVNDHYKKISKSDYENNSFDLNVLDNSKYRLKYTSIYNLYSMIKAGLKKVLSYTLMKKILLIGFFVSAMFIVYAISSIFGVTKIEDDKFIEVNKNYIKIENNSNNIEDYLALESSDFVSYIMPGNSIVNFNIKNDTLLQLQEANVSLEGSLADNTLLSEEDIIYGNLPNIETQIVLDKLVIDSARKENETINMLNMSDYEDFVEVTLQVGTLKYTVSGICDSGSPSIYLAQTNFIDLIASTSQLNDYGIAYDTVQETRVSNYDLIDEDITIKSGRAPVNDYEVIVNIDNKAVMPLNKTIDVKVNSQKLKVVGYYYSKTGSNEYYVSSNTFKYSTILNNPNMTIYAIDENLAIESLKSMGYNAQNTYEVAKEQYIQSVRENILQSLIISGILLAISFVEIFLMIRASFLSRIKEVGIYRAIGVKKTDIYKMFLGEILVISTLAGMPGAILMSLILNELTKISFFTGLFQMNACVVLVSVFLIYFLNILVGLLPIRSTIKHSPAEILSRNDVD